MMFAWSFAARTVDEVARLIRALSKHRYVAEVDHRLHWSVDAALAHLGLFAPHAAAFAKLRAADPDLDVRSRDPRLWRAATLDEIVAALGSFWTPDDEARRGADRLCALLGEAHIPLAIHEPFAAPADDPPHPELVLLDWVLLPVDELDTERHAGALRAMEDSDEEVNPSAPIYQEGPTLSSAELCHGAPHGVLLEDFLVWSEPPYSYADYVFRGASKAAKLVDPPMGYEDL